MRKILLAGAFILSTGLVTPTWAQSKKDIFQPEDVFHLEWASDPQISPDGRRVVYVRNFMDVMSDRARSNLWIVDTDGSDHRPLTSGDSNRSSPRWSPDGDRLAYISTETGSAQINMRWMDTGETAKITNLTRAPGALSWSPDGSALAFSMFVPAPPGSMASMPNRPAGAEWAEPAIVIEKVNYRADGEGYLEGGFNHLFVVPADGGAPRQVTSGDYNHSGAPAWSRDGRSLVFSANRHDDWETNPVNSEVYSVSLDDGALTSLTERDGPDTAPVVSPDGSRIAYLGNDDHRWGYHVTNLYVMNADGSAGKQLIADLDRDVAGLRWSDDGGGLFFQYDDEGNTKVAFVSLAGEVRLLAESLGGNSIGRPYGGGSFSTSTAGSVAYTYGIPSAPADVAVVGAGGETHLVVTALNDDVLDHKELGQVEEIWFESSHDGRRVQGWIMKPPGFDPARTYPLVLEIHGGPFANYGDRFAAELQLYAAAGNVVLYTNPRGSTSYGQEFGNLIHHKYPGNDYDDLMSGVDAVIERGYVDADNLFVTGGSGGGVLTAWIVGKTDRFRAAVSQKPVINWYSWALTADIGWISNYWFPGPPWDYQDQYMARSPISLVGNVTTPTMLLTGEEDHRTPIPESEQFYQALKMRGVDAALVRIPGSSHGIASRPSNLIAKVQHVLAWFDRYKVEHTPTTDSDR